MKMSRRNLLQSGGALLGLWASARVLPGMAAMRAGKVPIGLQLYSVRKQCEKDLPGVLEAVAKMGYKGVEFAGYYGYKAADLRKLLDSNGLVCCGTHAQWRSLQPDQWKATVEFNETLGNKFLIVPWLPESARNSLDAIKKTAEQFNRLAEQVKPAGMLVGYHAHGGDFAQVAGDTAWNHFFRLTRPEVVMQLDVGNCLGGGGDPYKILAQFPGRALTIHLKEYGGKPAALIGEGKVRWEEIFRLCETVGGTQWYIVEQESYAFGPLESVRRCLENLKKMGK